MNDLSIKKESLYLIFGGCISLCRIVASKMGSENTAHGASPRVGVPTNPGQFEMHPI
jgi:hypothetical protein